MTSVAAGIDRVTQPSQGEKLLAISLMAAKLPVIGRHLRPLAPMTAIGLWALRNIPDLYGPGSDTQGVIGSTIQDCAAGDIRALVGKALAGFVPADDLNKGCPAPERTPPIFKARQHRRFLYRGSVRYGTLPTQSMDVWRRQDEPARPAPVVLFVPGGGWISGRRAVQGYALMSHLAALGWLCLSIDYRVSPHHRWPAPLDDVKTAIAWARAHAAEFGGDSSFVALAGCSAGGHLASLAALTACNDASTTSSRSADTGVDAVVSLYGRYDWEDQSTPSRRAFVRFLEQVVMQKRKEDYPKDFRAASPAAQVCPAAPPFLLVHGTRDSIIPVDEARCFAAKLQSVSTSPTAYIELPGAGHAFDLTDGRRTGAVCGAAGMFLTQVYRARNAATSQAV